VTVFLFRQTLWLMRAAQLTGPIKVSGVVAIRALFGYSGFTQQKRVGKALPGKGPGADCLKHTNQRQHHE